jgi:hypothetical protein
MKALKLTLALFLFSLAAIAQTTVAASAPTSSSSSTGTTPAAVTAATFDPVYWAHQPPAVAALAKMAGDWTNPVAGGRTATAVALATEGYTIDGDIDVYGWDPYTVMYERSIAGYTWVPSLLQPNLLVAPGLTYNGQQYNPAAPPAGSIKVSLSLSDYPPFAPPPATPAVAVPQSCVGAALGAGYYGAPYYATVQACALTNGAIYTADPRGYFAFHVTATPFGSSVWFTSQSGQ